MCLCYPLGAFFVLELLCFERRELLCTPRFEARTERLCGESASALLLPALDFGDRGVKGKMPSPPQQSMCGTQRRWCGA